MIHPWLTAHWTFFLQRLEQHRLAHALLIEGPAGNGKKALADAMVARLLCAEERSEACGQCRSCKLLAGGAHPDRFTLQPEEGKAVIKVEQVRDLIASLELTCSISVRKVACIHPAESMSPGAANALLKSLEEPAGDTVLILVSNEPARLPVTIRSRCQSIVVNQPDRQLAVQWLVDTGGKPESLASAALQAAGGSPLRAACYLDGPEGNAYGQVQQGLATLLARPGSVSLISTALAGQKADDLWRWLSLCTVDAVKLVLAGRPVEWVPAEIGLQIKPLLALQRQADINRRLSTTPVRGDLLLQDWLIRWAEQMI